MAALSTVSCACAATVAMPSTWWRSVATAGLLPELWRPAQGRERGTTGGRGLSRAAGAPVGVERPVPVALPVCEPPQGHGPGAGHCLPLHRHAPGREGRLPRKTAQTGAVTLIQRFGSALNLNIHFHMLFLDGVNVERPGGTLRFRWVKAPTSAELTRLTQTLARRISRCLERQGWLTRDAENSYLAGDERGRALEQLLGLSITYRIAIGPQGGARCPRYSTAGVRRAAL